MGTKQSETIVIDYGDYKSIIILVVIGVLLILVLGNKSGYALPSLIWIAAGLGYYFIYCEKYEFHEDYLEIKSLWRPMKINYSEILGIKKFPVRYLYILYVTGNQRIRILHKDFFHDKLVAKAVNRIKVYLEHNQQRNSHSGADAPPSFR